MSQLFSPLPDPKVRWRSFLLSWGIQGAAVVALVNLNLVYPQAFMAPARQMITNLVPFHPPVPQHPQPVNPKLIPKPTAPRLTDPALIATLKLPQPRIPEPQVRPPQLPMADERPSLPRSAAPKGVATNLFSTGSSAMPTTLRPESTVQTGGFGDPYGVPAQDVHGRAANINARGAWDLPAGAGNGNGTGGGRGVPGVVVSGGFGSGIAIEPAGRSGNAGTVREGVFSNARPPAEAPQRKVVAEKPNSTPVEILYKPRPEYSEEARQMKIEGEVKLHVTFTASGKVQVVRILTSLGHGLDEQAVRAARGIKFKPAQRDGQAVDSNAILHIIFQLA